MPKHQLAGTVADSSLPAQASLGELASQPPLALPDTQLAGTPSQEPEEGAKLPGSLEEQGHRDSKCLINLATPWSTPSPYREL